MIYQEEPENFDPRFEIASCIVEHNGQFLLLQRQVGKSEGNKWGVPAGKIEPGEEPIDAIYREIQEETGYNIPKSQLTYFRKIYVRYPTYDFIYHMFNTQIEQREKVKIFGALNIGANPLREWPVALSLSDPEGIKLFLLTLQTDLDGNFNKIFDIPQDAEIGNYTLITSAQWDNHYVIKEVTFNIEDAEQNGYIPPISLTPIFKLPMTLIASIVAINLALLSIVLYTISASTKRKVTTTSPSDVLFKKVDIIRKKTCSNCEKTFSSSFSVCPFCFTFHSYNKGMTKYEILQNAQSIKSKLKIHKTNLNNLDIELNKTSMILHKNYEDQKKIKTVREHVHSIRLKIFNLTNFITSTFFHN